MEKRMKLSEEEFREVLNMHAKSLIVAVQGQAWDDVGGRLLRMTELWNELQSSRVADN